MSDTIELPLTKGKTTIIDAADFEKVGHFKWICTWNGYAYRTERVNGKRRGVFLHRLLVNAPEGLEVDHINGDRLDNRVANLRLCTHAENARNRWGRKGRESRYVGICLYRQGAWRARIYINGKTMHLGVYPTEEEAARAYDVAARKLHGEFATLNFPKPGERSALSGGKA